MPKPTPQIVHKQTQLVQRLAQVGIALSLEKDPDALLEMILNEAQSIAHADGGTLYYLNAYDQLEYAIVRTHSLHIAYGGKDRQTPPFRPINLYNLETNQPNDSIKVVHAVLNQKPINIADVYEDKDYDFKATKNFDHQFKYRTQSVLTIPMVNHKHEAIACLQLVNAIDPVTGEISPFSDEIVTIVQALASQAAVILDNKQLIESQRNLLESFIKIIAQSIDAKSPYTGNHCERVPVLTEMLAEAACNDRHGVFKSFSLTDEEKYELHIAAWLHDCGKIVTPVHVMDKATKLETIHDRISEILTRIEVMKRDAKIAWLEGALAQHDYDARLEELVNAAAFLTQANKGSEFMDDEDVAQLNHLATEYWQMAGQDKPLLTETELYNLSIRRGTITPQERQIMNDHMVHTVNMLESMPWPKHLRRVPEYACGHHEKMDGTGYPRGLLASTMSVPARMMAVADVFEALTAADRPYKPAKKLSESMAIIAKLKQLNHLDPQIVDFFITSGVYKDYARRYLDEELIDAVDEEAILNVELAPMQMQMRKR